MEEIEITATVRINIYSLKEKANKDLIKDKQFYWKQYYQNNKEKIKEYSKQYYRLDLNKERYKHYAKEYYEAYKKQISEKKKKISKEWYERNKEQLKLKRKELRAKNKKEKKENITQYRRRAKTNCNICGGEVLFYTLKRHQTSFKCKQIGTIEALKKLIIR